METIPVIPFPNKKYGLIYADPPWSYKNVNTGGGLNSGSAAKYSVMSIEYICHMNIQSICNSDCVLFLWATVPLLPECLRVLSSWGFQYKTSIFWRKIMSLGLGFWFRGQVEVCLVGIKGDVKAFHSQRPNFIEDHVREHSRKPDKMYEIIEELNIQPMIELFARYRREGWDSWGNGLESVEMASQRLLTESKIKYTSASRNIPEEI